MSDTQIEFNIQLDTDVHNDDAQIIPLILNKDISSIGKVYHVVSCMDFANNEAFSPRFVGLGKTKIAMAEQYGQDVEERFWEARDIGRALSDEFGSNAFDYLIYSACTWTSPSAHSVLPPRIDPDRKRGIMTMISDISELNKATTTEEYLFAVENLETRYWFTIENAQGELINEDADCYQVNQMYMDDRGLNVEDHPRYKIIENVALNSCLVGLSSMFKAISTKYNSPEKLEEMIAEVDRLVATKEAEEPEASTVDT